MTHLTAPIVYSPADLKADPSVTTQIVNLINAAFWQSKVHPQGKWEQGISRFESNESYYDLLGDGALVAVIFDKDAAIEVPNVSLENGLEEKQVKNIVAGKVVACSAAVPWKGGSTPVADEEGGWEIKAVSVDGDARYLRKGLAVLAMECLEDQLIEKARAKRREKLEIGVAQDGSGKEYLQLWIRAAECINGPYWERRGYREVRRSTEGKGTWGCLKTFELVVYRKEVEYDV